MNENNDVKRNSFKSAAEHIPIKVLDSIIILGIAAIAVLMFK